MKTIMMVWEDEILYKKQSGFSDELHRMILEDGLSVEEAVYRRIYGGDGSSEEPSLGMMDCDRPIANRLRQLIEVKIIEDTEIPAEAEPRDGTMRIYKLKIK